MSQISFLPIYDKYFNSPSETKDWDAFKSSSEELAPHFVKTLFVRPAADFSIRDTTWTDTAWHAARLVLKTAFFSWTLNTFARRYTQRLGKVIPPSLHNLTTRFLNQSLVIKDFSYYRHPAASLLKVLFLTYAFYETARYITQRLIMLPFYPAQSRIVKVIIKLISFIFKMPTLDQSRLSMANELYQEGFVVRHVFLEKKGVRYSGLLIGHKNTITNGNWVLQATGNLEFIEDSAHLFSRIYNQYGFNTLLVNGPCVGRSEGEATPETMGDAQEAGLSFIETALRAKRVVIAGRSLGGAAVGLAIKKHEFKKCIHYLVVRQMTFDRASNIGGKRIGQQSPNLERHVANTIKWAGCEMDSIAASERLVQLKIKEVIIQASNRAIERGVLPTANDFHTDGPILAEASLGHGLIQKRLTDDKVFLCLPSAGHMAPETITAAEQELLELLNVLP